MNDLQAINEIVNESVKTTSYWSVIISSTVFIIYTLIIKVIDYFKSKEKDKPIIEMSAAVREVSNNVIKLNTVLDKIIQDSLKKDNGKCKTAIELSFIRFKSNVEHASREIIVHNNIEANRELITSNINQKVSTEFYKVIAVLGVYEVNDICVASHLKEKWIDEVSTNVISIIYNGQSKEDRITQISNKLHIIFDGYITYVNNKSF